MEGVDEAGRIQVAEANDWPDRQGKVCASFDFRHFRPAIPFQAYEKPEGLPTNEFARTNGMRTGNAEWQLSTQTCR
jgi:hypothetical protein